MSSVAFETTGATGKIYMQEEGGGGSTKVNEIPQ